MIVVDVNLLLYAVIDGFPQHEPALRWWEDTVNSSTAIGLTEPVVFGFLRLSTNARLLDPALDIEHATQHVHTWLDRPNIELLTPGRRHLDLALGLLTTIGTAGNLTTDAQIAAYAIERSATLCSNDTDFGRFPGLQWENPLATA